VSGWACDTVTGSVWIPILRAGCELVKDRLWPSPLPPRTHTTSCTGPTAARPTLTISRCCAPHII
jgi:hypothetical protein